MAARVIWEEYHCVRAYSQAGQRKHALEAAPRRTIPQFIAAAARSLLKRNNEIFRRSSCFILPLV
jgi:hypothetical protein